MRARTGPTLVRSSAGGTYEALSHHGPALFSPTPTRKGTAVKNTKKYAAALAGVGVAATLISIAPLAHADRVDPAPISGFVAVGSDTLQDVVGALSDGTSVTGSRVRSTASGEYFASYNATGTPGIQAKIDGPTFGRPNGSGDGVKALSRSIDGAPYTSGTAGAPAAVSISGQVDIARSSSGPGSNTDANGPLVYLPFGRDALSYAYSGDQANLGNLNAATLKGIFDCTTTSVNGTTVTPVIPQAGSGTRKDFIGKIGLTENDIKTVAAGGCVQVGQEHDTQFLADGSTPFPQNAVTPISVAQWVAQNTGAANSRIGEGVKIGSPIAAAPTTGSGATVAPNKEFYDNATWGRDTYLVVEYARIDPSNAKFDAKLDNLLGETGSKLISSQSALASQAGSVKQKFGFLAPNSSTPIRAKLS